MHTLRYALPAALAVILASCSAFQNEQAVRMDPGGPDLGARWNANLTSPNQLSGAVNITGSAWMAPVQNEGTAEVSIEIQNAAPGGIHPWQVHRGRCGTNRGFVGSQDDYQTLRVGEGGKASSSTRLEFTPDDDQSYFVAVYAAPTNRDLIVACGNLAAPSN